MNILKFILTCLVLIQFNSASAQQPWKRHTIDNTKKGADGVRLADFDGDGRLDIVTGWEESGIVRLYLNPGPLEATNPWPRVTVGTGKSPEDAVPFDVDGDGRFEIVSCHEGKLKQVQVHRFDNSTSNRQSLLNPNHWQSTEISQLDGQQWMFATPLTLKGKRRALVLGSKNKDASLTLLWQNKPGDEISLWKTSKLRSCGWIMSIHILDMDQDGDNDIVFSDRKSKFRSVGWLEQPANPIEIGDWKEHSIGATKFEPMFIDSTPNRILVATRNDCWLDFQRKSNQKWESNSKKNPAGVPFGKAIKWLGNQSIVLTCNTHADRRRTDQPGIWIRDGEADWATIDLQTECKFDRMELLDLDEDGDLDVITCEERQQLGVIWYENPSRNK